MAAPSSRVKRKRRQAARAQSAPTAAGTVRAAAQEAVAAPAVLRGAEARKQQPTVDLPAERRRGKLAAVCAIVSLLLTIAAVPIAATGPKIIAQSGSNKQLLLQVSATGNGQLAAMWVRVISVLILTGVAWFLDHAVGERYPKHARWITPLGIIAFLVIAVSTAVGFYEVRDAAHVYITSGPRTGTRADHLLTVQRDKGPLEIADIGRVLGAVLFGIWIAFISYEAMQAGILTRFLGIFGMGAGITNVIGIAVAPALFLGWLASIAALAWGWWPGGRPPAWDAGRAISWDEVEM